ncbi:MAG: hypothetical protein K9M82_04000 [Deltaproteobacteria bacterium]|nr:hypothetical protein [Deltaproteobacteria bacterium]
MKTVKEIELTLKDEPGQLSGISDLLGASNIRIIAFHVSNRGGDGRLSFVADNPEKAVNLLSTAGYDLETHDVIACEVPSHPGGLSAVLKPLKRASINVDTIYPCLSTGERTTLIVRAQPLEDALQAMKDEWIRILGEELYTL